MGVSRKAVRDASKMKQRRTNSCNDNKENMRLHLSALKGGDGDSRGFGTQPPPGVAGSCEGLGGLQLALPPPGFASSLLALSQKLGNAAPSCPVKVEESLRLFVHWRKRASSASGCSEGCAAVGPAQVESRQWLPWRYPRWGYYVWGCCLRRIQIGEHSWSA